MIFTFFLACLVTARAIRLIVDDTILDKPRWWINTNPRIKPWVVKGIACPWCVSAWLAVPPTVVAALILHRNLVLLWWPAIWWGAIAAYFTTEALAKYATKGKD